MKFDIMKFLFGSGFSFLLFQIVSSGKAYINFGGFICPREEKALQICLRDALNMYIPKLVTGVPEYDIPSCDPLNVPKLAVSQMAGPITVTSTYTDVVVRGPSKMKVKSVKVDPKNHEVIVNVQIPELKMKGNYRLAGRILMLPIEGEGTFNGRYGNIDAEVKMGLGRAPRQVGPDALTCDHMDVTFEIGEAAMHLDNLFGGDDDLGNAMNKFLNTNWHKLADELQAPMQKSLREFFKPLADHAFSTLNADDILSS